MSCAAAFEKNSLGSRHFCQASHAAQAYRFDSAYAKSITPDVVTALSQFTSQGWRSVRAESVPPDHAQGHRYSTPALIVSETVHCIFSLTKLPAMGTCLSQVWGIWEPARVHFMRQANSQKCVMLQESCGRSGALKSILWQVKRRQSSLYQSRQTA